MNKYTTDDLSRTIDAMRIPMTILVICIHFNIISYPLVSHGEIIQYDTSWVQYVITFFSEVIGRLAVPFFFFTSGYFFFLKDKSFTMSAYLAKMRKRFSSLFVPYIMWWIIAGVLIFIMAKAHLVGDITIKGFLCGLWCNPDSNLLLSTSINTPLDGPLWFLRDLMVTMCLSPIIYATIKNKTIGLIFLLITSVAYVLFGAFDLPQYFLPGLSFPCLLFFGWGAYFGLHKINFLNIFYHLKYGIIPLALALMSLDLFTSSYSQPLTWSTHFIQNDMIHNAMILVAVPFLFLVGAACEPKMNISKKLSSSSFTIFALHKIIILPLGYILIYILHIGNEIPSTLSLIFYLGIIFMAFVIGVIVNTIITKYGITKKLFTGGR